MPILIDPKAIYRIEELEKMGLASKYTLRIWIKQRKLQAQKAGRGYVILGEDLLKFLKGEIVLRLGDFGVHTDSKGR